MSVINFELGAIEFVKARTYKLRFQNKSETEIIQTATSTPAFRTKAFQCPILFNGTGSPNFTVEVITMINGKETVLTEIHEHIPPSKDLTTHTISMSELDGDRIDGSISIIYKSAKATLVQSLRTDQIFCISIQAAHLNTLVETTFELQIVGKVNGLSQKTSEAVHVNNKNPSTFLNVSEYMDSLHGVVHLWIMDASTGTLYRVMVSPLSPLVVSIPMKIGDPIVLTVQCMYHQNAKGRMVTGTVHTSFMREASITQTPGSTARKISLSPRRMSSFDHSAAAVGLLASGQAIPSTKKTLLFLEDSQLNVKPTPNAAIIGGIQCAEQINEAGEVTNTRTVINHHEAYLTDMSTKLLGAEGKGQHVGPSSGAYIVCNSKSEMLVSDLGKKTHKKQSLTLNLGVLQIAQSTLTGPVRIRAKLVDLVFNALEGAETGGPVHTSGDSKAQHAQKASIAYTGQLEEASRELFNDTGLIACTLEGKLFKPTGMGGSMEGAANAINALSDGPAGGTEETCIAVKLYVSLIPSREEAGDGEEDEDSGSESGDSGKHSTADGHKKKNTDSAESLHSKKNAKSKEKLEKLPSVLDYDGMDKEILFGKKDSRTASAVNLSETDINKPYNVVTKESALPDELVGSSTLSMPVRKVPSAELLGKGNSKTSLVPPLSLGAPHSSTSLLRELEQEDEQEFLPVRGAAGAFGEGLDAVAVVRAAEHNGRRGHARQTAATGVAFAEVLRAELEQKQKLIDDLLQDVKVRSEAIQVCGYDIRGLREEQIRLNTKIQAMEREKEAKLAEEARADAITSEILKYPHLLHEQDKPALIRNVHQLRERVHGLDKDKTALQDAMSQVKPIIQQFAALKKDHHNLQEAHTEQSKYLLKMQNKINQVSAYQETIKTQEKIIAKMQSIVENKMRAKNALPFLPKQPVNSNIPVPGSMQEMFSPPGLPDFEAIQAQRVNEEELLQARREIDELNEKVQDLEHQLFDAKLDIINHQNAAAEKEAGEDSRSDVSHEEEIPGTSEMQDSGEGPVEMDEVQKAHFNDLKSANERIDQLEVESTSKSYRISALEAQLESSTRDYSREIARLRTKLFELEISAAMAAEDGGVGSAGDDDFGEMDMEMNLEELLKIPDPSQPATKRSTNPVAADPANEIIPVPGTPPSGPSPAAPARAVIGALAMQSPPSDSASATPRPALATQRSTQRSAAGTARKGDVVIGPDSDAVGFTSSPGSRPPSVPIGSARAAAISLKHSASAVSTADAPKDDAPKVRERLGSGSEAFDIDKLANSLKTLDNEEHSPPARVKSTTAPVPAPITTSSSQDLPGAKPALSPKTSSAVVEPATAASVDGMSKPASQVSLPASDTAESAARDTPTKDHTPTHGEQSGKSEQHNMHRVPKFRRKSGEDGGLAPSLGVGAEGPKDPDAIDKTVEITMEIIDSDQLSPRAEAVVRTKKDNKIVLALLNVKFRYQHDHVRRISTYQLLGLKLHGFSQDLLQNRFDPYLKLSYGHNKWTCITSSVKSSGQTAEWVFDPEHGFFDKLFKVTDDELAVEANSVFTCVVKKKNAKGNEDFESGTGSIVFTHELFKDGGPRS